MKENFVVNEYVIVSCGFLGNSTCPGNFTLTLTTKIDDWNLIIKEVVENINGNKNSGWAAFNSARIPQNELVASENTAAFVLLEEQRVREGYNIKEAIFVLRKKGNKISGVMFTSMTKDAEDDNYFRHLVKKIEHGYLYYSVNTRRNPNGGEKKVKISFLFS